MAKSFKGAADVEREISRLENSPLVKMAMAYKDSELQRRQYMEELQDLENMGIKLAEAGVTIEMVEELSGEPIFQV